jgi:hypothetical protein
MHNHQSQHCATCRKRTSILFNIGTTKYPKDVCYVCRWGKPNGGK